MANHQIVPEPTEETVTFNCDFMPIGDPNARPIDLIHGGPSRQIVITFDDTMNDRGQMDVKEIHVEATGFPSEQAAFVLHEISHMIHETNEDDRVDG